MTAWKQNVDKQRHKYSSAKRTRLGAQYQRRAESVVGGVELRRLLVELGFAQ
jgi:hypothetical protein